jgi:hypothetical protein
MIAKMNDAKPRGIQANAVTSGNEKKVKLAREGALGLAV